ncbi:unnamed protein product [Paramecium octaurelia]|uniref:Dynein heavy chain hydrolytic ATP-binding dynein motor region domain-containing protein n=1 Tax=Paramecium octaurelia TaxID=43137 RepID=A0A8S1VH19_PAROT|nr:unnamed protein product [Paramecium octaurelia]
MITCVDHEEVVLVKPLQLLNKVEIYLQALIDTLRELAKKSFEFYDSMTCQLQLDRKTWIDQDPAQIVYQSITLCCRLKKFILREILRLQPSQLDSLEEIQLNHQDKKLMCLITVDGHNGDTIGKLIDEHVRKPDQFQWQSQLKFYWNNKDAHLRITDASFNYSYEYLGNDSRLVITPLTDRIQFTSTQILHLKMGCALTRPAGTSKTEIIKDLANSLAKVFYLLNSRSEMNYESMVNIYKGLANSGGWVVLMNFIVYHQRSCQSVQANSKQPLMLYLIKYLIQCTQLKQVYQIIEKDSFIPRRRGDFFRSNMQCVYYNKSRLLGRSRITRRNESSVQTNFSGCPKYRIDLLKIFMAEGFEQAKTLAHKFVTLLILCRDLLSKQLYYDCGLRAIKSVLVLVGSFMRVKSIESFNIPKIEQEDMDAFSELLSDSFPTINDLYGSNLPTKK